MWKLEKDYKIPKIKAKNNRGKKSQNNKIKDWSTNSRALYVRKKNNQNGLCLKKLSEKIKTTQI